MATQTAIETVRDEIRKLEGELTAAESRRKAVKKQIRQYERALKLLGAAPPEKGGPPFPPLVNAGAGSGNDLLDA